MVLGFSKFRALGCVACDLSTSLLQFRVEGFACELQCCQLRV